MYLPDELYRIVKKRQLPVSELLQTAVRAELHRQARLVETDRYLAELFGEVGEPSAEAWAQAEALSRRILDRTSGAEAGQTADGPKSRTSDATAGSDE